MSSSSLSRHLANITALDKMLKHSRGHGFDCEGLTIHLRVGGEQSDSDLQPDGRTISMEVSCLTKEIVELLYQAEVRSAEMSARLLRSGIVEDERVLAQYMANPLTIKL